MNTVKKSPPTEPALRTINPKIFADHAAGLFGMKNTMAHLYIRRLKEAGVIPSGDPGRKGKPPKAAGITIDQAVILLLGFLSSRTALYAARTTLEACRLAYFGTDPSHGEPSTLAHELAFYLRKWVETSDPRFLPDVFVVSKEDKPCFARLRFCDLPMNGNDGTEERLYGVSPDEAFSLRCGVAPKSTITALFGLFCEGAE